MPNCRLRLHLVGQSLTDKEALAERLKTELSFQLDKLIVVPYQGDRVSERLSDSLDGHNYFLALEQEYAKYEVGRKTKAKHLIFVDSLVDRYIKTKSKNVNLGLYFHPRLMEAGQLSSHLFLYGPQHDSERSSILSDYRLPTQVWKTSGCLEEIVNAVMLRVRRPEYGNT